MAKLLREIVPLIEISKETTAAYLHAAIPDLVDAEKQAGRGSKRGTRDAEKRGEGINRAIKKLTGYSHPLGGGSPNAPDLWSKRAERRGSGPQGPRNPSKNWKAGS